jgi:hypothetical protein
MWLAWSFLVWSVGGFDTAVSDNVIFMCWLPSSHGGSTLIYCGWVRAVTGLGLCGVRARVVSPAQLDWNLGS